MCPGNMGRIQKRQDILCLGKTTSFKATLHWGVSGLTPDQAVKKSKGRTGQVEGR